MKRFQIQAHVSFAVGDRQASVQRPTFSVEAEDAEAAFRQAIQILGIDLSNVDHMMLTALDVDASQAYSAMAVPGLVSERGGTYARPTLSMKKL